MRHAGARELLAEAGARVDGTRARIPAALVDAALQSAPRHFKLKERGASGGEGHARRGELGGLELEDGRSYFGTGSDCVYITDPDTGERRQSTTGDVEGMAALAERLPNLGTPRPGTCRMRRGPRPNVLSQEIRDLILRRSQSYEIKKKAMEQGMITLRKSGLIKIKNGITSVDEVLRETMKD